jgi:hypothetical protein
MTSKKEIVPYMHDTKKIYLMQKLLSQGVECRRKLDSLNAPVIVIGIEHTVMTKNGRIDPADTYVWYVAKLI